MSLQKVEYIDGQTLITAKNLNDIQDNIIANENAIQEADQKAIRTVNNVSPNIEGNITITTSDINAIPADAGSVSATQLADNAVITSKINDGAVYGTKLLLAASDRFGGVKAEPATENDIYPVHITSDGKLSFGIPQLYNYDQTVRSFTRNDCVFTATATKPGIVYMCTYSQVWGARDTFVEADIYKNNRCLASNDMITTVNYPNGATGTTCVVTVNPGDTLKMRAYRNGGSEYSGRFTAISTEPLNWIRE